VNDLLIPEEHVRSGLVVEFEVESGERGLKATAIPPLPLRTVQREQGRPPGLRAAGPVRGWPGQPWSVR
ncbi:hypothetical protein ACFQ8O_35800, partial [Streptomyces coelicoflavus]